MAHEQNDANEKTRIEESTVAGEAALHSVSISLKAGKLPEAAKELAEAVSRSLLPGNRALLKLLTSRMGREAVVQLASGFAHYPCFYCTRGRGKCEWCEGRGSNEDDETCSRCLGMGVERCDFCDGSGQVTINYVPTSLQPAVLHARATEAIKRVETHLGRPLPQLSDAGAGVCVRSGYVAMLDLDRCLGVFENLLVAARDLSGLDDRTTRLLNTLVARCVKLAEQAEQRLRRLFSVLSAAEHFIGQSTAREPSRRRRAQHKAEFFERLVDPSATLAGTGIEHPFLHEAIKQAALTRAGD